MKNRIYFLKDIEKAHIPDIPPRTILTWHPMYQPPQLPGVEYVEWSKFSVLYSSFEPDLIIIVGLNRLITPSNRCDYVHEYLTTMTPNIPKISIDTTPFIGEPWRLFFHYLYTGINHFGINYSYPVEREWQDWFYRETNDSRLSAENVAMFIKQTWSNLDKLFTRFEFYQPNEIQEEWYVEAKKHVFSKHNTPKMLIAALLKLANDFFQTDISYDSWKTNLKVSVPNLGVYRFMVEENIRRMKIYNAFSYEELQRK